MNLVDHLRGLASSAETDFVTAVGPARGLRAPVPHTRRVQRFVRGHAYAGKPWHTRKCACVCAPFSLWLPLTPSARMRMQGCTLDAAGKIYSCRVDSVHNETFRVVHGLGRVGDGQAEEEEEKADGEEEEGEESGDEGESKKKIKKAAPTRSSTIENNPDALLQKKVETESNVDPLFQKMCKAFDEGGARGMLLNQLSLAPGCSLLIESTAVVDDQSLLAPSKVNQVPFSCPALSVLP